MNSRRTQLVLLGSALTLTGAWACSSGTKAGTPTGSGSGGASSSASSSMGHTTVVSSGVGGSGGSSGAANLGLACTQDSDCGAPLHCILPTTNDPVFGGGPANGYCSESCTTDADCPAGVGSCYLGASSTGDCLLTCTLGPKLMYLNDPLSPNKCQGRDDVRCLAISDTLDACVPTCGESSQCPTGEVCDPRLAVCVTPASASTGLPNGSMCDPSSATPQCAGICVNFTTSAPDGGAVTLCSNPCVLGVATGGTIANDPNCGGDNNGLCAYYPSTNGAGDYGFCAQACNYQSDCQNPAFWCIPISGLTGTGTGMVPNGFCLGATACPNGASDCSSETGTSCVQTPDGPFCLSSTFPLTSPDAGQPDAGKADGGEADGGEDDGGEADAGDGG